MQPLTRLTWPLPPWVALAPGLALGVATFLLVATAGSWPYVAPARLSGMIAQSVGLTAPVACAASAWVAERFTNRHSPIAWPILPRAARSQALRVLAVVTVSWALPVAAGGLIAQLVVLRRATGGQFYPIESVIAILGFCFFIVPGFLIGGAVARWHAPVWALVWALAWIWVVPVYLGGLFPSPSRNVEYFLFPGLPAVDHRGLDLLVVGAIAAWWIVALASCLMLISVWYGAMARALARPFVVLGVVFPLIVASGGVSLAHFLPSPFVEQEPSEPVCRTEDHLEYCVTQEQSVLLDELIAASSPAVERIGGAWPSDIHRVVSFSVAGAGNPPQSGSIGVGVTSATGIDSAPMDIGTGLGGLDSCDPEQSHPDSIGWALEFGRWLAKSPDAQPDMDPRAAALWGSSDDEVRAWYARHAHDLLACRYTGPGPG